MCLNIRKNRKTKNRKKTNCFKYFQIVADSGCATLTYLIVFMNVHEQTHLREPCSLISQSNIHMDLSATFLNLWTVKTRRTCVSSASQKSSASCVMTVLIVQNLVWMEGSSVSAMRVKLA